MAEAQRSAAVGDVSYMSRCKAQYEPAYNRCRSGAGVEACRENIAWIKRDGGAWASFQDARRQGRSLLDSMLFAQRHNPSAQQSITSCGELALEIAQQVLGDARRDTAAKQADDPSTCAKVIWDDSDFNSSGPDFWQVVARVTNNCTFNFKTAFCVRFLDQNVSTPQYNVSRYGPNNYGPNDVPFIGIKTKSRAFRGVSAFCPAEQICSASC